MAKKVLIVALLLIILLSGCAVNQPVIGLSGHEYGFWGGLWHGIIAPFDFIGMLFTDDIAVYAPHNNGGWYAFGFLLGIGSLGASSGYASNKK
jgi:hypothetical protein